VNIREKEELVAAPDHIHNCEACGQSPVVQFANKEGKLVYNSGICGSCYFGTGEMLNPENW
jgi:hypothetical protein